MKILALKIYANTQKSYVEGVPRVLDLLDEARAHGSFFFGMGTENTGSAMGKLFGESPPIVDASPGILRDANKRGHDCGVCGWNPLEWEARLAKIRDTTLETGIRRAVEAFTRMTGFRPNGFAAPGWQVNYISLRVQDTMRFAYCSDTFGFHPYLPRLSWKTFATPQIPDTLPPAEAALKGAQGAQTDERLRALGDSLADGLSVLPMNAGAAGSPSLREPLRDFLLRLRDEGVEFITLEKVAKTLRAEILPVCDIVTLKAHGMPRPVAAQSIK